MKCFIVHVGFYDPEIGIYELHSNFLVAAEDIRSAKESVKKKSVFIQRKMHIDGIQEILEVDGYAVKLEKSTQHVTNESYGYDQVKAIE